MIHHTALHTHIHSRQSIAYVLHTVRQNASLRAFCVCVCVFYGIAFERIIVVYCIKAYAHAPERCNSLTLWCRRRRALSAASAGSHIVCECVSAFASVHVHARVMRKPAARARVLLHRAMALSLLLNSHYTKRAQFGLSCSFGFTCSRTTSRLINLYCNFSCRWGHPNEHRTLSCFTLRSYVITPGIVNYTTNRDVVLRWKQMCQRILSEIQMMTHHIVDMPTHTHTHRSRLLNTTLQHHCRCILLPII